MRLQEPFNLEQFFAAVHRCRGEVRYISDEGDILNLKSRLCLFVFSVMRGDGEPIRGQIKCGIPEDYLVLRDFLAEE